ncbi:tetraacyldisaccharide 4'-kinase [Geojedonia litorea]|uniref:Tetraacyldisaccharide 4'-kinase n=1 Tax=Geojedonia litorea TaxID=1268269 RepID=A0ABV9N5F4_9FLAO
MKLLRKILIPFVPLYYSATWVRNMLYDLGIKSSKSYAIPVICVGNLSVGGTGKTPMIEYLIRLLHNDYKLATLSRGYKRKSKGFVLASTSTKASEIGDEPYQFFRKFKNIQVSVDTDRCHGIEKLLEQQSSPNIILLDDAFQHRKVNAGLNILLTPFDDLFVNDMVLPTGNLREPKSGAERADIIVVTKCPTDITSSQKQEIKGSLKLLKHQNVFFSSVIYSSLLVNNVDEYLLTDLKGKHFTLVTGIANPKPLTMFLKSKQLDFEHLQFNDHHEFSEKDIQLLKTKKLVVTTEKDFVRLESNFEQANNLYYLPIEVEIDYAKEFNKCITDFISGF